MSRSELVAVSCRIPKVDVRYDKGIRGTKALPIAAESPRFISVEVDVCCNRGIREAKAPPVAVQSLCYVSVQIGARYDKGTFDQHGLSGWFLSDCAALCFPPKKRLRLSSMSLD